MPEPRPLPDPVTELREDVADLQTKLQAMAQQLKAVQDAAAAASADDQAQDEPDAEDAEDEEEASQFPPFILLLDPPEYDTELRGLIEWVEGVLVPGYLAEASPDAHWCHLWVEHTVAVARLHALWLAWQELTDPAVCGYTGPSVWQRDHLRPCTDELRASRGPFAACTKGEHQITHRLPGLVPSTWYQDAHEDEAEHAAVART